MVSGERDDRTWADVQKRRNTVHVAVFPPRMSGGAANFSSRCARVSLHTCRLIRPHLTIRGTPVWLPGVHSGPIFREVFNSSLEDA